MLNPNAPYNIYNNILYTWDKTIDFIYDKNRKVYSRGFNSIGNAVTRLQYSDFYLVFLNEKWKSRKELEYHDCIYLEYKFYIKIKTVISIVVVSKNNLCSKNKILQRMEITRNSYVQKKETWSVRFWADIYTNYQLILSVPNLTELL